jgi:2-keto-4-pentenoate hydratase
MNMKKTEPVTAVAEALLAARRQGVACDAAPFADALRDADDAFAVQDLVLRGLGALESGFPRHWKAGGPGPGGVPSHAALPPQGVWSSPAEARDWPCRLRLIEAEIALRLGPAITPGQAAALRVADLPPLLDAMAVAIELVDSRWRQGMEAPVLLKLADLQSHAALVLGDWRPFQGRDWSTQSCTVRIGDRPAQSRRGSHALGDPLAVLPGLLRHMTRRGDTVPGGTVVSTGTWCGVLPAAAGELVRVEFEGIGAASLQL